MSDRHARRLFIPAALFNLLAGLPMLVATRPIAELLGLEVTPTATLFMQITMGVVVVFAWAYWMIARDPVRYRPYIVLGLLLKIMVVAVIFAHWLAGNIAWPLPALASGDILFALLFWRYYQQTEGRAPAWQGNA
jgi:hypothetical protein